jgi:gliding motility-associated protein GldL
MSLAELVQSSGWKNFIAKLYGLGASVVIIGALFKIQHWPLAGTMLTIGLLTEAVIFFFSAFEPLLPTMNVSELKNNLRDVFGLSVEIFLKPKENAAEVSAGDDLILGEATGKSFQ